jgi:hypothetical protein
MAYLLLVSIAAALAAGWIRGGSLSRLGEVNFRWWWLVPALALTQSLTIRLLHSASRFNLWHLRPLLMIVSYVILWGVVFWNRRLPGMWIVLLGVTLNLIVIAANGGYMPITPEALARIGAGSAAYQMPSETVIRGSKDVLLRRNEARFWMLGDVLIIPEPFPRPTAMSVGDLMLAVGIFVFVINTMRAADGDSRSQD